MEKIKIESLDVSAIDIAEALEACDEVFEWLKAEETFRQAWARCPRGDWMMWAAAKLGVELQPLTAAKAECAALVKNLMGDESLKALETARRFGQGRATREELAAAYSAAYTVARAAAEATSTAVVAAYAAARADATSARADAAWATSAAAYAAADAARADAESYADAAAAAISAAAYAAARADATSARAERKKNQLATANICREMLTDAVMEKVSEWFG